MEVEFFINLAQRAAVEQLVRSGAARSLGYYLPKVKMVFDSPSRGQEDRFLRIFTLDKSGKKK